jgi:hypothetical protein
MSDTAPISDDDVTLLVELLSLLPSVDDPDDREWWEQFSAAHQQHRRPKAGPRPDGAHYMVTKISQHLEEPYTYPRDFASYCLYFFDDPSAEMVRLVAEQLDLPGSGGRLLESICEVAWRVYLPLQIEFRREHG